jgi:NitT/TauT family transport system substrate-binding protein
VPEGGSAPRRPALLRAVAVPLAAALLAMAGCGAQSTGTSHASAKAATPAAAAPAPASGSGSAAPVTALVHVNAGFASPNGGSLPLWVALDRGFWRQNGLDVNLQLIHGGSANVAALIAGELQFAAGGPAGIGAKLKGEDVVTIANPLPVPATYLVTASNIRTPADFKGKTAMGSTFGSSADQSLRLALAHLGLTPGKDVKIIAGTSADSSRLAALESHEVQIAPLGLDAARAAVKAGFRIYANMGDMGFAFPQTAVDVTGAYLRSHRAVVADYLKGLIEAAHYIKTNEAGSEPIMAKYMHVTSRAELNASWAFYAPLFSRTMAPTVDGLQAVLNLMAATRPSLAKVKATEFVDTSVVDQLVSSGFVSRLYGGSAGAGAGAGSTAS